MSGDDYGTDRFRVTANGLEQVGGTRSYKPFRGESNSAFKARMQHYAQRLNETLVETGMFFVDIGIELQIACDKYTLGILTINHQPEAVDFAHDLQPLDVRSLMRIAA